MQIAGMRHDASRPERNAAAVTPVGPQELRRFASCFPTGVAIVTTRDAAGALHGTTMTSVTLLSLEPPLFLMCFGAGSRTLTALQESGVFCIHFLAVHQQELSRLFASKATDKFASASYAANADGVPVLGDVLAACEGRLIGTHGGGDHVIAVGSVERALVTDCDPLVFFRSKYHAGIQQ